MKSIEKFSRALILSRTQLTLTQIEAKQCNKAVEAGISSGADCSLLTAQALLLASQPHILVFPLFPAPSCSLSLFSFSYPVLFPVPFCPHLPLSRAAVDNRINIMGQRPTSAHNATCSVSIDPVVHLHLLRTPGCMPHAVQLRGHFGVGRGT